VTPLKKRNKDELYLTKLNNEFKLETIFDGTLMLAEYIVCNKYEHLNLLFKKKMLADCTRLRLGSLYRFVYFGKCQCSLRKVACLGKHSYINMFE
jgi:hypothetical protein